jgi:sugar phosphate isomerase/epimerase
MSEKIKICVNTWIFGNESLPNIVKRAANTGFDGIELVGEPEVYNTKEVMNVVNDSNMFVCSICGMHPGPEDNDLRALCHPEKDERIKGIDYVKACVDMACETGAKSVLVVPSLVGQPAYFISKEEDLKRAAESIAAAGEYAKECKIKLTIEPINRYEVGLVNSLEDSIKMAREIDNEYVITMGDTFHMQIEEPDGIPNAVRRTGGQLLGHMHAADNTRQAPGMGDMDWKEIIRALYDINYEGVISCEPLPKGKAPYDARSNNIPAETLDGELKAGLLHLRNEEERVRFVLK